MAVGYKPTYIKNYNVGLVQGREEMILPEDAFPTLYNAYIWRERIKRKQGGKLLGRLQRVITLTAYASLNLLSPFNVESSLAPGTMNIIDKNLDVWTDPLSNGILNKNGVPTGTVNYATGVLVGPVLNLSGTFGYFPNLPVMGVRPRELTNQPIDQTVFFDTKFAYIFGLTSFTELPSATPTTWTGNDYNFFWTTNFWINEATNQKLFWVTNFSGTGGDPLRYYDGSTWTAFSNPANGQINAGATSYFTNALCIVPFRGRLVAFNTLEGPNLAGSTQYSNRIRWANIGNPLAIDAWRDDIQGKGGFLNIPTNEDITLVTFVRDNLIVYCENSTWQLRYTGRTIAPFQIEKINSEFGSYSTFSGIQFDTSSLAVGDKGLTECDSFKSERFDIKIPDLIYSFNQNNNGAIRIQGARNFPLRLAYWIYVDQNFPNAVYPNRRLVYNYENDSWAIFNDSFTALGQYQPPNSARWLDYPPPSISNTWQECNFSWSNRPANTFLVAGGNSQGFILLLDQQVSNDVSITIKNITGNTITATVINSPKHNLSNIQEFQYDLPTIIQITGLVPTDPFYATLNNQIFGVKVVDGDNFAIYKYNIASDLFDSPQLNPPSTYLGAAQASLRDNFNIVSKKFNYLEQGQKYQLGYIDILTDATSKGEFTLNVYVDYNDDTSSNNPTVGNARDSFFNTIIPTNALQQSVKGGSKNMQRIFCATQGNFITLQYFLSNTQMIGEPQQSDVQIDVQTIWSRPAGRISITS